MDPSCIKAILRSRMSVSENDGKSNVSLHTETASSDEDERDSASNYSIGMKSPTAMRGRSVKEFEEQLTNLRKENFNLKLRIYFLEERMGPNCNLDKESAVKKNIELMVEIESLRKELQEKQDLLGQALKAMELEEEEHKKENQEKDDLLQKYQQQIEDLEQRLQDNDIFHMEDYNTSENIAELQNRIKLLEEELAKEKQNSASLENYIKTTEPACNSNTRDLEELLQQKEQDINHLYNELHELSKKFSNCSQRARSLETELERCSAELNQKVSELVERETEMENMARNIEILRGSLADTQELYKKEAAKSEKFKTAVMLCNNKMIELEKTTETQKMKIRSLEQKLETVQTEVNKSETEELGAIKSPMRRRKTPNTDVDSFSVPDASGLSKKGTESASQLNTPKTTPTCSPNQTKSKSFVSNAGECVSPTDRDHLVQELKKCKEELSRQREKNLKLKSEQFKACHIIKTMISKREAVDEETKALKRQIETLENEIKTYKGEGAEAHKPKSLHTKINEMKFTAVGSTSPPDNEKSMAESPDETRLLAEQYKTLSTELEKQMKILMQTLKEKDNQMQNLKGQLSNLLEELKVKDNRITDLEFELLAANNSDLSSRSHISLSPEKKDVDNEKDSSFWIQQIEEKDKEIERLEMELRKRTCDLQGIVNKELWQKNREIEKLQNRFGAILENKDHEIARLESSISAKEQQLVLLKEKISELGVPTEVAYSDSANNTNSSDDIKTLQERLNACQQERIYFMGQIESLQKRLHDIEHDELDGLRSEIKHLQNELEKSEKLRGETNEVCGCLSKRLEELALFLDSLLQKKSVLGFLGWKQNSLIKQVVNQSLELSKTLSVTISQNPNQSLMEISNVSALLTTTQNISVNITELLEEKDDNAASFALIPSDATLTYQSHLHKSKAEAKNESVVDEQNKIIKVLREQIQNLKHEIELRDIELNKIALNPADQVRNDEELVKVLMDMTSPRNKTVSPKKIMEHLTADKSKSSSGKNKTETHSESESWSEPDRTVSMARIGLDDDSLKPVHVTTRRSRFLTSVSTESTEDELSRTLTRTPSKRTLLAENRQTIISLHGEVCDLERKLKETEEELRKTREELTAEKTASASRQRQLDEFQERIKVLEQNLAAAKASEQEAEVQLKSAEKAIGAIQIEKAELQAQLIYKDKMMMNRINELKVEKDKAVQAALVAEKVAEEAKVNVQNAEAKLKSMQCEMEQIAAEVRKACEDEYKARVDGLGKEFEIKVQNIESKAKTEIEQAQTALKQLQTVMYTDYVQKVELERQTKHLEKTLKELEETKGALYSAEIKLNELERQEAQWKQKVRDVESQQWDKITALHKELDSVNLQYSEAVLEKTKLNNEKTVLEQKLKSVDVKETELMLQAAEFQREVGEMKEAFQKQIAVMENKKTKLEMRVSELESINAELKNKLIVLQTGINEQFLSSSLPVNANKLYEAYGQSLSAQQQSYRRQFSDNSGYTSEDQPVEGNREVAQGAPEDVERQNANSSPDLGIESDHGRFSSLEANIPRPLLQTLELTESMSNLLDVESQVQISNCNNEQCCKKTQQIVSENSDLKRRLLRTRRALEETVTQLTIANQRKKQVEKTICKQIHKTSQVLRKAKANLDSGSETDVVARK